MARTRSTYLVLVPLATVASCIFAPEPARDGRSDSFLSGGEADGLIDEGSPEALGVLEVANTLDRDTLVGEAPDGAGIATEAADSILAYRAGADGEHGTDDDRRFASLAELDALDFVGPVALDHLLAYAWTHDIVPVCGDEILQVGEECDPPGPGCDASCQFETTAFRITSLALKDPHPFAKVVFFCKDVTGNVNSGVRDALGGDDTGDGFLDLSPLAAFRPFDPGAETTGLEVMLGQCTSPAESTTCEPDPDAPRVATTAQNRAEGTCLGVVPGTGGGYSPPVVEPEASCFASESHTLTVPFGDFEVSLSDAQVAATYDAPGNNVDPRLTSGLIRGFISEAEADALVLPDEVPVVGGRPLSRLLPGGSESCADHDARDVGPDGALGWYFYLNFEAEAVPFFEPGEGDGELR